VLTIAALFLCIFTGFLEVAESAKLDIWLASRLVQPTASAKDSFIDFEIDFIKFTGNTQIKSSHNVGPALNIFPD
jgi:hypothetical protein